MEVVQFQDLGNIPYQQAWTYQESLLKQNIDIKSALRSGSPTSGASLATKHYLLFCEHPPVYTLGKSGSLDHLLIGEEELQTRKIEFFKTNRGGDITFHGPGQIVGYPILDLEHFYTDIGRYLRSLEEVIIQTLEVFGIQSGRSPGETGVWLDPDQPERARKICAMGVRCSRWVTMHGFALNVNTDMSYFSHIIPCGIADKQVTSMQQELYHSVNELEVKELLKKKFAEVFQAQVI